MPYDDGKVVVQQVFTEQLLMLVPVLGTRDAAVNKTHKNPSLHAAYVPLSRTDGSKTNDWNMYILCITYSVLNSANCPGEKI